MAALLAKMLGASISNHQAKVNDVRAYCCASPIIRRQGTELHTIEEESIATAKFAFFIKDPLTPILSVSRGT
jgi:hypothetical protein